MAKFYYDDEEDAVGSSYLYLEYALLTAMLWLTCGKGKRLRQAREKLRAKLPKRRLIDR